MAVEPDWREIFNSEGESAIHRALEAQQYHILENLFRAVEQLTGNLRKFKHEYMHDASLVIVIDEASSLLGKKKEAGLYIALNRIISCLKKFPIWFFLSPRSPRSRYSSLL